MYLGLESLTNLRVDIYILFGKKGFGSHYKFLINILDSFEDTSITSGYSRGYSETKLVTKSFPQHLHLGVVAHRTSMSIFFFLKRKLILNCKVAWGFYLFRRRKKFSGDVNKSFEFPWKNKQDKTPAWYSEGRAMAFPVTVTFWKRPKCWLGAAGCRTAAKGAASYLPWSYIFSHTAMWGPLGYTNNSTVLE